jgi:hypothetical protein
MREKKNILRRGRLGFKQKKKDKGQEVTDCANRASETAYL